MQAEERDKEVKANGYGGKSSCHLYGKSLPRFFYSTSFKGKPVDCISLNGLDKVYCQALTGNLYQFNFLFMFVLSKCSFLLLEP